MSRIAAAFLLLLTLPVPASAAPEPRGENAQESASAREYAFGLWLYERGLYHSAQHHFIRVLGHGPRDPYFPYALPKIAAIAQHTGNHTDLDGIVHRVPAEAFPGPARDILHYRMALNLLEDGDGDGFTREVLQISGRSPYWIRARFAHGAHLATSGNAREAVLAFRDVYQHTEDPELQQLALLNVARTFYGIGAYEESLGYYQAIDRDSVHWPVSLLERAWAELRLERHEQALGSLLSAERSGKGEHFLPEVEVLRALVLYELCDDDGVERVLSRFEDRARPMLQELERVLAQHGPSASDPAPGLVFASYFEQPHRGSTLPSGLFASMLRNRELVGIVTHLEMMRSERKRIDPIVRDERTRQKLHAVLQADQHRYRQRAGWIAIRELEQTRDHLAALLEQSTALRSGARSLTDAEASE